MRRYGSLVFLSFFCVVLCRSASKPNSHTNAKETAEFQKLYAQFHEAERRYVNRLRFSLAPQRAAGSGYMLTLKDNYGRYWLFKDDPYHQISVATYRLFDMVDLRTPSIFSFELRINNRIVRGSLQQFVESGNTLTSLAAKSAALATEISRHHLLYWLLALNDARYDQHLLKAGRIYRLDTDDALIFHNNERFASLGRSVFSDEVFEHIDSKEFMSQTFSEFIRTVESIPVPLFRTVFKQAAEAALRRQSELREPMVKLLGNPYRLFKSVGAHLDFLEKRRQGLRVLYTNKFQTPQSESTTSLEPLIERFRNKLKGAKNVKGAKPVSNSLEVKASFRGWRIVRRYQRHMGIAKHTGQSEGYLSKIRTRAKRQLDSLTTEVAGEKEAIAGYKRIISSGRLDFHFSY